MIEALKKYAGPFRMARIQPTMGKEGSGWLATVLMDGEVIGTAADYGDGGQVRIDIAERAALQALVAHAHSVNHAGLTMEIEHVFLGYLVNYEISVSSLKRKAKKKLLGVDNSELDENGVASSYTEFKVSDTPEFRAAVLRQRPAMKFLNDELAGWQEIKLKVDRVATR